METIYQPSFAGLNKSWASLQQEEATAIESFDFVKCYTHNSSKGWYLCYHHHWWRNVNAYPNIYFCESIFLFKGNSEGNLEGKKHFSQRWRQYIHTAQNTNLTSIQNIHKKIDKQLEDFHYWRKTSKKNFSMGK